MDNSGTSVRSLLFRFINNQKKHDNNYIIAQMVLKNFDNIPRMTIYELADACFVSTSAVSRFIRLINFSTYTEFKDAVGKEIDIVSDYSKNMTQREMSIKTEFLNDFTTNIISNLDFVQNNIPVSKIEGIVSDIFEAGDVAVFGLEFADFMGQHFQSKMGSMNKIIQVGFTVEDQLNIIDNIKPNGLALIFSMEGGFFYFSEKVITALKRKNVKIITFTFKKSPIIERSADEIIICGETNENTEGRISILYVMELLIYYYMRNYYLQS
ncbi:MurR/RpiR family transcriptional regulator [Lactiplantibacillus plantarum]|uniref:MurR/RpiR family transcriptional regulator n=1 Tax=Lapidilactobacillus mulanensis TaxID=2485999 RepID=A0ABW4DL10_9LACO|nr:MULTISPECIES: MurR/RpiR family transcriptional regulator [Lactobacillaceae]MCB7177510.1 MurR/RpiR family transcriptional regulator [Lactiplantibacillus plantarum]QHM32638.1 hypothetical protein C7M34_03304 [Lactiplantibacillus plantarum]